MEISILFMRQRWLVAAAKEEDEGEEESTTFMLQLLRMGMVNSPIQHISSRASI